jgi:hypothetical protein
MAEKGLPAGWRSDDDGNVYRLLTPSERAQVERARDTRAASADNAGAQRDVGSGGGGTELASAS